MAACLGSFLETLLGNLAWKPCLETLLGKIAWENCLASGEARQLQILDAMGRIEREHQIRRLR